MSNSVVLNVFRNRCWMQLFTLYSDANQTPLDVSGDSLALVVIPCAPGASGEAPIISNISPSVDVNAVTFDTDDATMGLLNACAPYQWQFLRANSAGCSSVIVSGPLIVTDSPPFPLPPL